MIFNNTWTPENMYNAFFIIATHLNSGTYIRKCVANYYFGCRYRDILKNFQVDIEISFLSLSHTSKLHQQYFFIIKQIITLCKLQMIHHEFMQA